MQRPSALLPHPSMTAVVEGAIEDEEDTVATEVAEEVIISRTTVKEETTKEAEEAINPEEATNPEVVISQEETTRVVVMTTSHSLAEDTITGKVVEAETEATLEVEVAMITTLEEGEAEEAMMATKEVVEDMEATKEAATLTMEDTREVEEVATREEEEEESHKARATYEHSPLLHTQ